jgi:hypothetical protein
VLQHRLSRDIVKEGELGTIIDKIASRAGEKGFSLVIENEADVFQCEASYTTTPDGINIYVHIPIARDGDVMDLYRHTPLPMKVSERTFVKVHPKHDVLAISRDLTTFKNMDRVDIADCHHVSDVFLCEGVNTKERVREDTEDLCLYNLFRREFEHIETKCPSDIGGPISDVQTIGHNHFVFFSKTQHEGTIRCHGKEEERFTAAYVTTKKLEPGCVAETDTHIAAANLQLEDESVTHAISWPYKAEKLLGELDAADFEVARLEAEEALEDVPTDTRSATKWLAARNKWQLRHMKEWSGLGAFVLIGLLLLVVAVGYCAYKARHQMAKAAAHVLLPAPVANAATKHIDNMENGRNNLFYNMVQ